jgi:hypothetical protein
MGDLLTTIEGWFGPTPPPPVAGDSITEAAIRAKGIDPATDTWIAPQYDNGQDPAVVAAQAVQDAENFYNNQYAQNKAELDAQSGMPSIRTLLFFGFLLLIVAGIHEVKTL